MDRKKYLEKYFTKEGVIAMENRLKNLIELYLKKPKYPFKSKMYGYLDLEIISEFHHQGMIDELSQILGKKENIVEVKEDGN